MKSALSRLCATAILFGAAAATAALAAPPASAPPPTAAAPSSAPAPTPAPAGSPISSVIKVPEGTELRVRFNDSLSSGKNAEGDQFSITLEDDIDLGGGTVIKRGYRGKGEVTAVKKKGMMGQAGEMNVRLNYIRVGDTRIRLRAQKGGEGQSSVGTTVVLTVLFGPLGLLKHGHDLEIKSGQVITAYVDEDAKLALPLDAPPRDTD